MKLLLSHIPDPNHTTAWTSTRSIQRTDFQIKLQTSQVTHVSQILGMEKSGGNRLVFIRISPSQSVSVSLQDSSENVGKVRQTDALRIQYERCQVFTVDGRNNWGRSSDLHILLGETEGRSCIVD